MTDAPLSAASAADAGRRLPGLDLARGLALVAMAVFHFVDHLTAFGYLPPGTSVTGGWAVFSRLIAGTFLALAGVSLYLAHGSGIRVRPFLRRLAVIAGAAALVSVVTYVMFPERFVFYGILHSIAAASVLGLVFVRAPGLVTLAAGAAMFAAAEFVTPIAVEGRAFAATGLSAFGYASMDFVPLFPWAGVLLFGLGAAQVLGKAGLARGLGAETGTRGAAGRVLAWAGSHSLAVYLIHQPILFGLVLGWTLLTR